MAVAASTVGFVSPSSAAPVAALTNVTSLGLGTVSILSSACNGDGSGTFTFTATSQATGSIPGTLTEIGTVTLGPPPPTDSSPRALSYSSTFEITGPAGTVVGTTQMLEPPTGFFGSLSANNGRCIDGGNMEVTVETTYSATITLPDNTVVNDFGVGRVFAGVGRHVSPSNATHLELESSAVHATPDPGLVTVRTEGVVNYVDNVDVAIGDPYVLEYTFEQSTPASYRTRTFASFPAVTNMSLQLGGSTISSPSGQISVANFSNDEYGVSAYETLTETGNSLFPGSPYHLQLHSGGNNIIAGLDIPLDPTVLNPQYRFVAVEYRPPNLDCEDSQCRGLVQMTIDSMTLVTSGPDGDGDGVADDIAALDGNGAPISGAFDDGSGTNGSIVSGSGVLVEDAPAPDGVRITTTNATSDVTVRMCGLFNVRLSPGSDVTLTCGSVTAVVFAGQTIVELGATGSVTIPTGGQATVDRLTSGDYVVTNNATTALIVTRNGVTTSLDGGATTHSAPQTQAECKNDGWREFGNFENQGRCVSFVSSRR